MSVKSLYVCTNCDAQFPKWSGRCLECGAWGTLNEEIKDSQSQAKDVIKKLSGAEAIDLRDLKIKNENRLKMNWPEIDRVLGGGLLNDSFLLLSGEPGIGKSTLAAQIANNISQQGMVLYVSGEESASQVKSRLERINCSLENLRFISETSVEKIIASASKIKPKLLVVDSIQTVYSSLLPSEPGNISQIRAVAVKFLELAKSQGVAVLLIGHITKDGQVAGPKSLEHIVDTVLSLEHETGSHYSLLRASKNRFGSVNELGVLEMTKDGFKEVVDPGAIFLAGQSENIPGSVITGVLEGSRPFLVNIQALVSQTIFGYPQRKTSGLDVNRLQVLSAVINKRLKFDLISKDIILNAVGGLKINDPAIDLAVCGAIVSSYLNRSFPTNTILMAEVGLGGEIRPVFRLEQRLNEASKLGFKKAIVSNKEKVKASLGNLKIEKIINLNDLLNYLQ
jgi:DNA repair protein RadA/Sms